MCAVFQIFGNCSLLIIQLNNSTISFKQNCKTKINLLGDIPSTQFAPDLHLLNSLRISHCETKISDKYISGKIFRLEHSIVRYLFCTQMQKKLVKSLADCKIRA